jgi:carbonic anhydrase
MNRAITILFLVFLTILNSCKNENKSNHSDEDKSDENKKEEHWSYDGETSPEHWSEIEKNSDCAGKHQSPINIIDIYTIDNSTESNEYKILYSPKTHLNKVKNNGHSIQFDFEKGDSIKYNQEIFHLKQLHFHEPSEHTINGIRYPIEIHLVHKNSGKNFTVLSILCEEGTKSKVVESLESYLPLNVGKEKEIQKAFDLTTLFPDNKDFYSYRGSLTTPPCTENVNWVIFKNPIIMSLSEVIKLKENMPINNYRDEQPLNDRKVYINYAKK